MANSNVRAPRNIDKSLLIVNPEHPLDTLPFIADALTSMGTMLQSKPDLGKTDNAESGVGLIIELLGCAVADVQQALESHNTGKAGVKETAQVYSVANNDKSK